MRLEYQSWPSPCNSLVCSASSSSMSMPRFEVFQEHGIHPDSWEGAVQVRRGKWVRGWDALSPHIAAGFAGGLLRSSTGGSERQGGEKGRNDEEVINEGSQGAGRRSKGDMGPERLQFPGQPGVPQVSLTLITDAHPKVGVTVET